MAQNLESGNAVLQTILASEGNRALKLLQQRQRRQKDLEDAKNQIENETKRRKLHRINEKYQGSSTEALEEQFRQQTVGLVTADEFREKRKKLEELKEQRLVEEEPPEPPPPRIVQKDKTTKTRLSFKLDSEEESDEDSGEHSDIKGESEVVKKKYFGKDPTVNTSFLADKEREEKLKNEKEKLIKEYHEHLEKEKQEMLEIVFSYYDGSGHRRSILVTKGSTIGQFLLHSRQTLEKDFPELRSVSNENLMYIKEDLILPHHITFHELIRSKARGKSGPLFHFDVHEDIRLESDIRKEKDESHAGKIVDRKWYERNKHIFPASRWEMVRQKIHSHQ